MSSQSGCDTLRILHLPPYLSDTQRDELFKKYGAMKTRTVRRSEKYTMTFAKFPSKQEATEAFLRLHQLEVRGQHLSVEFAKKSVPIELSDSDIHRTEVIQEKAKKDGPNKTHLQAFLKKLNNWANSHILTQPPPPNIWYKYSPPTKNTLLRIAIQLLKEPAFYTQVLHLMNKMNLPPPFEELDSEFPMLREVYNMEKYKDIFGVSIEENEEAEEQQSDEEEESELESDEETHNRPPEIIPVKRKKPQSTKRLKIPKFVNPTKQNVTTSSSQKPIRPEDMFESVQRGEIKKPKIELKNVSDKLLETSTDTITASTETPELEGGFGLMYPTKKNDDEKAEENPSPQLEEQEFITAEQLASNRISANDQRLLPVFKNYHAGKPSCRLYIKNLAKQVESKDLHFIYKKYVIPTMENPDYQFEVRLMQEGRMKGQAFVTLQNTTQAQLALEETNGYILKDKPMVVQFAKAAKS
ncbi:RNA-binding protein 40 [Cephus cinctus]|uniref:RNA-binding region-containing protein 3 n=1 Tax=Cephus cinctus TaxID=211228 RepID=A0AAJ7BNY8_CEPCN|nr:RNA-binding protein 40 [Cephus cinctus]